MKILFIIFLLLLLALSFWLKRRAANRPFADEEQEGQTRPWREFMGEPDDN